MIEGTLIDAKDVPPRVVKTNWVALFKTVPKGKALKTTKLTEKQVSNMRNSLTQLKKRGKFRNYFIRRQNIGGINTTFIAHMEVTDDE